MRSSDDPTLQKYLRNLVASGMVMVLGFPKNTFHTMSRWTVSTVSLTRTICNFFAYFEASLQNGVSLWNREITIVAYRSSLDSRFLFMLLLGSRLSGVELFWPIPRSWPQSIVDPTWRLEVRGVKRVEVGSGVSRNCLVVGGTPG